MSREWKPGDVALVECSDGEWRQATCEPHANGMGALAWRFPDRFYRYVENSAARPLALIDPEDSEHVERLAKALYPSIDDASRDIIVAVTAKALREFANPKPPKPPKPDAPMGLGAVVETVHGELYVRDKTTTTVAHWKRAKGEESGKRHRYADLDVVRVHSQGWEVDQ